MSRHWWQDPLVTLGGEPTVLQCTKCGKRETTFMVLRVPSSKTECPGMRRSFRRALRRYIRLQTIKERNHGKRTTQGDHDV